MNTREQWLQARQQGIGGSDVAAIVGLSPYRTPLDVYLSKTAEVIEDHGNEFTYWGTVLEDVVAKEFKRRTGLKIQRVNQQLAHPEHPWMLANIDRAIVNPAIAGTARWKDGRLTTDQILECKTASAYAAGMWGESGDAIPVSYVLQVQWYLGVTGCQTGHLAALIGGNDYRTFHIERDDELINELIKRCATFWHDHVQAGVAPAPINVADILKLYPHDSGEAVEANPKSLELLARAAELKARITELEEELNGNKKQGTLGVLGSLKAYMRDAASLVIGGEVLATYKEQQTTRLDTAALKSAEPELYAKYSKTTSSRVLRLK